MVPEPAAKMEKVENEKGRRIVEGGESRPVPREPELAGGPGVGAVPALLPPAGLFAPTATHTAAGTAKVIRTEGRTTDVTAGSGLVRSYIRLRPPERQGRAPWPRAHHFALHPRRSRGAHAHHQPRRDEGRGPGQSDAL